jgi:hypothetical protein
MQLKITVIAIGFFLCAAILLGHPGRTERRESGQAVRFPSARTSKDGEIWLDWGVDRRTGFVDGYIKGRRDGHNAGCHAALAPNPGITSEPTDAARRCFAEEEKFTTVQVLDYVDEITSFYKQYPSDRDVPLNYVLDLISDRERKTSQQIHQHFLAPSVEH